MIPKYFQGIKHYQEMLRNMDPKAWETLDGNIWQSQPQLYDMSSNSSVQKVVCLISFTFIPTTFGPEPPDLFHYIN